MEIYENILGNLTPSELDELAPAGFDAKAPRGAVKRIEKAAVEKAGLGSSMSATVRKRRSIKKPLIIAAAAVVASAATLFTVNASMEGNLVRFFINGEEVEGEHRDYVDHDGYRHVTFEAVVPLELTNYAVIVDVDNPEEFVRVFTEDTDPEFLDSIRQYREATTESSRKSWELYKEACAWKGVEWESVRQKMGVLDQIYEEAVAAGAIDPADRPTDPTPEDFGIFLTDSQELIWEFYWTETESNGVVMCHGEGGGYSGKFKYQHFPKGAKYYIGGAIGTKDRDYENNTKTIVISYVFYVGKDYVKESGKEIEGSYRDYVDHDGYRNVSFDAILPVDAENYAVIFDSDAPNYEDAVRVLTDESDPEFFESLRQYHAEFERIGQERNALMDAGGDENDLPEYREAEEFGLVSKDSEVCCWNISELLEDGRKQETCGAFGGKLKTTGTTEGRPPQYSKSENIDYDNGTKSVHLEVKYYVGLD